MSLRQPFVASHSRVRILFGLGFGVFALSVGLVLTARAFTGPSNSGGVGSGAISSDASNNVAVGTSTTSGTTKLYVVASSTANSAYGLRVIQPNTTDIFSVRNDGLVSVSGTLSAGTLTGTMSAANISSGAFGQNTGGGNYSLPAGLGIGVSSPTSPLHVLSTDTTNGQLRVGYDTTNYLKITEASNGNSTITVNSTGLFGDSTAYTFRPVNAGALGGYYIVDFRDDANTVQASLKNDGTFLAASLSSSGGTIAGTNNGTLNINSGYGAGGGGVAIAVNGGGGSTGHGTALQVTDGGTAYLTVLGKTASIPGGVGVGTASPQQVLHAFTATNYQGVFVTGNAAPSVGFGQYGATTPAWKVGISGTNGSNFAISTGASNADKLTLDTSGNIGIATSTPGYPLTVAGTIYSSSGGYRFPDGTTQTTAATGTGTLTASNVSAGQFGQNTGGGNYSFPANLSIGTTTATYPVEVFTGASPTGGVTHGVRLQQLLTENTNNNGFANALYINPTFSDGAAVGVTHNALVTIGGNVGIGSASTAAALDVQAAGIAGSGVSYGARFQQTIPSAGNSSNEIGVYINPTFDDGQAINVTHAALVVGSGNVGLGISLPTAKLHVFDSNDGLLTLGRSSATYATTFNVGTNSVFTITSGGVANAVTLNAGKLGIGTTTPSTKLHVFDSNDGLLTLGRSSATYATTFNVGTNSVFTITSGGVANAVTLKDGKLGIGNSNPTVLLAVGGSVNINGGGYLGGDPVMPTGGLMVNGNVLLGPNLEYDDTNNLNMRLFVRGAASRSGDRPANLRLESTDTYGSGVGSGLDFGGKNGGIVPGTFANISGVKANSTSGNSAGNLIFSTVPSGSSTSTARMTIFSTGLVETSANLIVDGSLGIGMSPSYQLQLSTDSAAKPNGGSWTNPSDIRLKEDVRPFTDGLATIMQLNPKQWEFNGHAGIQKGTPGIGVVAQEAKAVIPYAIGTYKAKFNPEDAATTDFYSFNPSALNFISINAIKELNAKVDAQQQEIDELKADIQQLKDAQGGSTSELQSKTEPSRSDKVTGLFRTLRSAMRAALDLFA